MIFRGEYEFLSNFHSCEIKYDGLVYPSSEHAYQAAKSFNMQERKIISGLTTPGKAKRHVTQFPDANFHNRKIEIMYEILKIKFQIPYLKQLLNNTGTITITEDNTWKDTFWGVCNGEGKNILGTLLMVIRYENRID